jgi:hypothetical protein
LDKKQIGLIIGAVINGALLVHALVLTSYLKNVDSVLNEQLDDVNAVYNAEVMLKNKNAILGTIYATTMQTNDTLGESAKDSGQILSLIQVIKRQNEITRQLEDEMVNFTGGGAQALSQIKDTLAAAANNLQTLKNDLQALQSVVQSDKASLATIRDNAKKMDENTP